MLEGLVRHVDMYAVPDGPWVQIGGTGTRIHIPLAGKAYRAVKLSISQGDLSNQVEARLEMLRGVAVVCLAYV